MRNLFLLLLFLFTFIGALAQKSYYAEPKWPEQDTASKFYTVKGERHGVSFFKKHYFKDAMRTHNQPVLNRASPSYAHAQ